MALTRRPSRHLSRGANGRPLRTGVVLLAAGGVLLALVHLFSPSQSLPLYDGFIPEDPYRFLDPPPGQLGDPGHLSQDLSLRDGRLPAVNGFTDESPPQAQMFALKNTFTVPRGTASAVLTIDPIEPPKPAPKGTHLVGNVYRVRFVTSDGTNIEVSAGKQPSVVLRGVTGDDKTTMNQLVGGQWKPLKTSFAGGTMRYVNVDSLGDFVLIANGPRPKYPPATPPIGASIAPSESPFPTETTGPSSGTTPSPSTSPATLASPSSAPSASPTATISTPSAPVASASASPSPSASPAPSAIASPSAVVIPLPTPGSTPGSTPPPVLGNGGSTGIVLPAAGLLIVLGLIGISVVLVRRRSRS